MVKIKMKQLEKHVVHVPASSQIRMTVLVLVNGYEPCLQIQTIICQTVYFLRL